MITGLDHVVVVLNDIEAGTATYELLLGRAPSWRSRGEGSQTVLFTLDNMSLELMAPSGESATARRIRDFAPAFARYLSGFHLYFAERRSAGRFGDYCGDLPRKSVECPPSRKSVR